MCKRLFVAVENQSKIPYDNNFSSNENLGNKKAKLKSWSFWEEKSSHFESLSTISVFF